MIKVGDKYISNMNFGVVEIVHISTNIRGDSTLYLAKTESGQKIWHSPSDLLPYEREFHIGETFMVEDGRKLAVECKDKDDSFSSNKFHYTLINMDSKERGWFTGENIMKLKPLPIPVITKSNHPVDKENEILTGMNIFAKVKQIDNSLKYYEAELKLGNYNVGIIRLINKEINYLNSKREKLMNEIDNLKITI